MEDQAEEGRRRKNGEGRKEISFTILFFIYCCYSHLSADVIASPEAVIINVILIIR